MILFIYVNYYKGLDLIYIFEENSPNNIFLVKDVCVIYY